MSILTAQEVVKDFSGHRALNRVSMEVPRASIYGLLGPNGAGKTTLLRIINQITAPDHGSILFEGRPIKREDTTGIGYLPEERGLYRKMKVGEQALYLAQLKGMSKHDATTRLKKWFERFEMGAWWNKKVEELSKGMAQKVQFITTVIHQPRLLIFDEPFSGFDPINVKLLKQEILEMKKNGATIIFSTHNMSSVEELCSHITLINEAETILQGEISSIREKYQTSKYRVTFTGDPERLHGELRSGFEVEEVEQNGKGHQAIIRITEDGSSEDLIRNLLEIIHIKAFYEVLPGMNEIFIQAVTNHE
ncbi:MAG: ATP-binding cassette domain-containing protein [Bacteroidales bacterium]